MSFFKKKKALFLFAIVSITLASFWRVLFFDMWIDDSSLLWASLHNFARTIAYYNHPGLALEFQFLAHIFGTRYVLWQIIGITIKVCGAIVVGYFASTLTKSKKTGFLASLFFAASYLGLEVVDAPIMNIAGIVTIPLLLSLVYFIRALTQKVSELHKFVVLLILSFILDPGRVLAIIFVITFILDLYADSPNVKKIKNAYIKIILTVLLIGAPLFIYWFIKFESTSQVAQGVWGLFHAPLTFLPKINRLGNLTAAIANVFIGLLWSLTQNEQDTGVYNHIFGYLGALIAFIGLISYLIFKIKKSRFAGVVTFFIFWTFLWYVPNWFSEPRAPMAGPHQYLYISSIGFVCLIAFLISKIRNKFCVIALSGLFLALNIYKANSILAWQSSYRWTTINQAIWNKVTSDVPSVQKNQVFLFSGEEPWLNQNIQMFGQQRYMLYRNITNAVYTPSFVYDDEHLLTSVCTSKIPLSHVFAWQVHTQGRLVNVTNQKRAEIAQMAQQQSCHIIE